jgi:hypothetical protein
MVKVTSGSMFFRCNRERRFPPGAPVSPTKHYKSPIIVYRANNRYYQGKWPLLWPSFIQE